MNPIAFYIFGISIRWYAIFISTGMLIGIIIAKYNCKYRNIDFDSVLDVVLISLPMGIIGARLYYVVFQFNDYKDNLISILNIRQGGLAIHGGILFAVLAAYFVTRHKKLSFLKMADATAPSIVIAQSLGRWGNFFNGEAHGGPVSYGFIQHFPSFIQNGMLIDGVYYQPTFLYESTWNFAVFIILMITLRRSRNNGLVFFTYLGLYSAGRFLIEGLRTDSLMLGPFRIAQLVSLIGVAIWIAYLILNRKSYRK
ncbi:prolipoprotein diacylglyceryl transferase [Sinanaerobacter chloroacetimidivorans]|uniref:Phosphatidylglycerol--prolipoprotein diacylglyceryl transferase n=1 Tax=Sinanaerobacter chloroacetimidivorans TaxID=2818044 RepID=A0A8J7W0F4_9FIRM|nr:prolipoprotein diacylglyceryl transferase [Sinanaerobacter chloroacetimidivorans]MBR0598487.1 prolipoprotein diacylglyceryl transferase [Sinanaerobacter chloroacetimidivorans]